MKIGVADYGMNMWYGGQYDYVDRVAELRKIGFDGIERIYAQTESHALYTAANVRRLGGDFATCLGPTVELSMQWTAAFGKEYMWVNVNGKDFDTYCRQVNEQVKAASRWGVKVALHNHLGSLVETQEQLDEFMTRCPGAYLLLDAGHLAVAGGDVMKSAETYYDRLVAVHVKGWQMTNPDAKEWYNRGYFCEIGGGNFPVPNEELVKYLVGRGFDKWIMIEHDTHLQDALTDLKISRERLAALGA